MRAGDTRWLEHHHFALSMGLTIPLLDKRKGEWMSKFDRAEEQLACFEQRAIELNRAQLGRLGRRAR